MERYYVVENVGDWNNIHLVVASNKKEAIKKVYEEIFLPSKKSDIQRGYAPYTLSDFSARRLEDFFESGQVATLH